MNAINENVFDLPSKKRVKRTEADMLAASKTDPLSEAMYLKERITKLEDKISSLLGEASGDALELLLKNRPQLKAYLP